VTGAANEPERSRKSRSLSLGIAATYGKKLLITESLRPWEREMAVRVMTGYVAHELNHPLGTIINLANILSRRLADPVVRSKDISEHVKNIKAEAVRATSIIKNMRMLTEHKPVAHESLSLVEVCHDTIARMKPLAKSKQVKIRFEVRT